MSTRCAAALRVGAVAGCGKVTVVAVHDVGIAGCGAALRDDACVRTASSATAPVRIFVWLRVNRVHRQTRVRARLFHFGWSFMAFDDVVSQVHVDA